MRKLFTENEIILCTYIARCGRGYFNEKRVTRLENRSEASVKMKVQNIAAMLKEEGFQQRLDVSPLCGVTTGDEGRRTNWDVVAPLTEASNEDLKHRCKEIFRL